MSRGWVTWDGEEIANFSTAQHMMTYVSLAHEIRQINQTMDYCDPAQREGYSSAYDEAQTIAQQRGIFSRSHFYYALESYVRMSIDEAVESDDIIVRAASRLDRRLGERRLRRMIPTDTEHPLVTQFYALRCEAEGIHIPEPSTVR